jgi:hypothetical protein
MGLLNSKNRLSLLIAPGLVSSFLARLHLLRVFLNHPDPGEENERPYPSAYGIGHGVSSDLHGLWTTTET